MFPQNVAIFWGIFQKVPFNYVFLGLLFYKNMRKIFTTKKKNHWPEVRPPKKEKEKRKKDSQFSTSGFNI
jgi:hypothetical protein